MALDAQRTPGDWYCSEAITDEYDCEFYTISHYESERPQRQHYEETLVQVFDQNISKNEFHANAAFIKHAPEAYAQLRAALERIDELENARHGMTEVEIKHQANLDLWWREHPPLARGFEWSADGTGCFNPATGESAFYGYPPPFPETEKS